MKSLSLAALITLTLSGNTLWFSVQAQVKASELEEARKVFSQVYKEFFEEKDKVKKYEIAKAFFTRFPTADDEIVCCDWVGNLRRFVRNYELGQIYSKCQETAKSYFASPNGDKLNHLLSACDVWLDKSPKPDAYYTTRLALATGYGLLANFYKDTHRSFTYAEKSLQLLAPEVPPEGWKPEDWPSFRRENVSRLWQYQGLCKLRQEEPDVESAILYLTKVAEAKEGPAFKDMNTYLLRAEANFAIFSRLDKEYSALPDDSGKEKAVLARIYPIIDNLIADYARVMVLAGNNAETKTIRDDVEKNLLSFSEMKDRKPNIAALLDTYKKEFGIK